jgi:hypothetical protein
MMSFNALDNATASWRRDMASVRVYAIEERLQNVVTSSRRQFLVFPEGSVRRWTAATDEFWAGAIGGSG